MKLLSMKWLQISLAIIAVLALVIAGCGGGGGGGSSEPIKVRTLSGTVYAPVAPPASLQPSISSTSLPLSGSLLAAGGSPVANAKVWLEGYRDVPAQYTDASGTYRFVGVAADEHFVVSSFEYLGKTYKQRTRALVQTSDIDVTVPILSLEEATQILTGVLKDSTGTVLPAGTEMMLWGEVFTIGSNGSFSTPALPGSIDQAELFVKLPGATSFTGFHGPFTGGTTPAFIEQTVLPPDSGNRAPSGALLAKNISGTETVKCVTGEQLSFSLTPYDPDTGHLERLKYVWTASRGTLQVTGNQTTANWVAMDSYGLATITVAITDPEGVSAKVSLRILVNIQSADETDTTPPTIVSRTPAANAVGVPPASSISVEFSEALLGTSVTAAAISVTSQGVAVSGASTLQADKKTIIWNPTTALPGNKTISVSLLSSISDLYGNQLGEQSSWSFTTALVPGVTVNSLYTNDSTPEITGTVDDPEATVSVTVNSRSYNAVLDGTVWKVQVTDTLADGVYNVSAVATNKVGISGSDSSANELTIDTGAKTAVLSNLPPVVTSSRQTAITVGGTGVIRYIYRHRRLGDVWPEWSAEKAISEKIVLTDLNDGIYNLQVRAIDTAGNLQSEANATSYEWTVDTTVKIAQFDPDTLPQSPTNQTSINVTIGGSGVQLYRFNLNEGSWSGNYPVTTPLSLVGLRSGTNILRVIGGDSYGNWQSVSSPSSFTWVIDANVKIAVLLEKPTNPSNLNNATIKVGGTGVSRYKYSTDGGFTWSDEIATSTTDTIALNGLADGSHSIKVVGGDELGTWQAAANATTWTWTVDTNAPTVEIISSVAEYTNIPVPVEIVFSEPVKDFSLGAFTDGNFTLSNLRQLDPGKRWSFDISPIATGPVSVVLPTGAVTDLAANPTANEAELSFYYDSDKPLATLKTTPADIAHTNAAVPMTLSFDKPVEGFDINDLTIVNGTASGLASNPARPDEEWSFLVTPSGQGEVTIDLAAGKVVDVAGNFNTAANHVSFIYDSIAPTVAFSTNSTSPTSDNPIKVIIEFSETITGFDIGDVTVANGSAGNLSLIETDKKWSIDVTPPPQGEITVSMAAGAVADAAGNPNVVASPLALTCDSVRPSVVSLTTTDTNNPTSNSPIPVTIEFSEAVSNFQLAHLSITNGTAGNLQIGMVNNSYTFDVTPQTNGVVIVGLPENRVADAAGNYNLAAPFPLSKTYDSVQPTAILTTTAGANVNAMPIEITIEFNKDIVDFDLSDLTISNGTPGSLINVTPFRKWTFSVNTTTQGVVTVYLAASKVHDSAGNANKASNQIKVNYDSVSPTVTITSTASESTNLSSIPIRIEFSEVVSGFDSSDLQISNFKSISTLQTVTAGKVWTTSVTPDAPGNVTVYIAPDSVTDAAGNGNTAASPLVRDYDIDRPGVVISSIRPDPTNSNPIPVTITFDEDINGFDISHLVVGNGSVGNLVVATPNRAWTADVTPSAEGYVTVEMAAGKVTDIAGNTNEASNQFKLYYDATKPVPVLALASGYTSPASGTFKVNVTFNDDVDGFTYNDLSVTNGSPQDSVEVVTAGRSWNVSIAPSGNGTYTIDIDLGVDKVTDASGNGNAAATRLSVAFDNKSPTATLSTPELVTSANPIPVTVKFDEPISDLSMGDFAVSGCTVTNLQPVAGNSEWIVQVVPSVQGNISISLPAGKVIDVAGNGNEAASPSPLTINYTSERPAVAITSTVDGLANQSPIPLTITFSEAVNGFVEGDLVVGRGSVTAFTSAGDGKTWTLGIIPGSDGTVTVDVPASSATDLGGNGNTAAAQFSVVYDSAGPTVVLSTTSPAVIGSGEIIPITIKFNEDIDPTSFTEGDLTITNGNVVAGSWSGSGKDWTCEVERNPADFEGVVSITLAAGRVTDLAGNGNADGNTISVTYDTTAPTALLEANVGASTSSKNVTVTLSFSKPVEGFTLSDLTPITNGTASNLQPVGTGNSTWTFTISAISNGLVELQLPAGVASDTAGNGNAASNIASWSYDSGKPSVTLAFTPSLSGSVNSSADIGVTVTFSEPVGGFVHNELVIGNGTSTDFIEKTTGTVWTASITPTLDGLVTINVAADVATDTAGNGNTAASQISVTYDNTSPLPTLTTSVLSPTNVGTFPVTISFPENVTGFDVSKLIVNNGSVVGTPTVVTANRAWRANIQPDPNTTVTVSLNAGAASDTAGNLSLESASNLSWVHDSTKPVPTFTTTTPDPASTTVAMTVTFSEPVTGLVTSDFTVGNGYVTALSGGPEVYTLSLVPTNNGLVTLNLAADKVLDAAKNGNVAAAQFTITYDKTKPTVVLSSSAPEPTSTSPIPVTISFSEPVSGFVVGDLVVSNGVAGGLTETSPGTWTVNITPDGDGVVTVNLPAGVASDTAGNGNSAAVQLSRTFDSLVPTVTIATATIGLTSPTNVSPIPIVIEFSEVVNGFSIMTELVVGNGTISNPQESVAGKKWLCNIVPTATGTVTVNLAAGVASDSAGNLNSEATQFSIVYDSDRPAVVFSSVDGGANGTATNTSPIPFYVTFNKDIKADTFTIGDIAVTNGTAGNLTLLTAKQYSFTVAPNTDGAVYVNMAASKVTDETGNLNTAAAQFGRVYDTASPAVMLTPIASLTNGVPFGVTVTFYEDVQGTDLTTDDFEFEGASGQVTAVAASVAARIYTVTVKPLADPVKMKLPAGKVRDLVGNYNSESNEISVEYDVASPTVTISSNAPDPTNVSPIPLTITFSEKVTGFTAADLQLDNATLTTGISENSPGLVWSANLVPLGDGDVAVDIAGSVASDTAGNGNLATDTFKRVYDATPPGVTFSSVDAPATNKNPITFKVVFDEKIATSSFVAGDITVSGGNLATLATITEGVEYEFTVIPSANGNVIVGMAANMVRDAAGNFNPAATSLSVAYDTVRPTVTLASDRTITNNTNPFTLTVTFSEVMKEFNSTMLSPVNCNAGTVTEDPNNPGRVWTVVMTANGDPATVKINASAATDLAGNGNTESTTITVNYDSFAPGVTLTSAVPDPTNVSPIVFTVTSTEMVNGLTTDDFDIDTLTANVTGIVQVTAGRQWNVNVVPVGNYQEEISVSLKAGAVTDLAGNLSDAAGPVTRKYDAVRPTVTLVSSGNSGTFKVGDTINITVTFSETIFVTNTPTLTLETGTTDRQATYVSGNGTTAMTFTYTVQSGDNSTDLNYNSINALLLSGGTIRDDAGNAAILTLPALDAAESLKNNSAIIIDAVGPRVVRVRSSSPVSVTTAGANVPIQVEFDEAVTILGTSNSTLLVNVTNSSAGGVVASATYVSHATNVVNYVYVTKSGDKTTTQPNGSLNYTATNALKNNDSVFRDQYGNTSTYTLPPTSSVDALITSGIVISVP